MASQILSRFGQKKTPTSSSDKTSSTEKEKIPARFQFDAPRSQSESPGSIQRTGTFGVRQTRTLPDNLTTGSREKLIDAGAFSNQNPWTQAPGNENEKPASTFAYTKSRTSTSIASLAAVKKFLKKDYPPLPRISDSSPISRPTDFTYNPPQGIQISRDALESRDFSASFTPTEIVIQPQRRHPLLTIVTKPESPLSMGGGLLHGDIAISVMANKDSMHTMPIAIAYLSVDLVGVELCNRRHHVFQSLAVDLIDRGRPPPAHATPSLSASVEGYWDLVPSTFTLPFQLQLPENPGPPPFSSRYGSIRYLLSATAIIRVDGEDTAVRDSCEVFVLGPHIPRVSLVNLPQPLNAMDTFVISRGLPFQDITLRASLNRDVWASGMSIFVDVHVRNRSLKFVSKVTLSLERVMMIYHHPIAQLDQGLYRQSRLPDKIHRKTVASRTTTKSRIGWRSIPPHSRESKTWMLNLPTGLATINTGRYFGVRYFLKVSLHLAFVAKSLEAQLPVTILDPNSLDITSEFVPLQIQRSRPRPSTVNSELPAPSLRGPYGRRAELKTPTQGPNSRSRRETWQWVAEVSPHPSLVPSPLLPTFGPPAKSGRTPSRLRVENRLSPPPVPLIPDRLRPPMENRIHNAVDLRHHNHTSDYPLTSTSISKPDNEESYADRRRPLGTSTLASLQEHVEARPKRIFPNRVQPEISSSNARQDPAWVDHRAVLNPYNSIIEEYDSPEHHTVQNAEFVYNQLRQIGSTSKRSPRRRKPIPHRRGISRSKDVQSIYRPLSSSEAILQTREKNTKGAPDNGWETVENFF